ncbi:hypothetical protein ACFE04_021291 [Oxalis oulophora]
MESEVNHQFISYIDEHINPLDSFYSNNGWSSNNNPNQSKEDKRILMSYDQNHMHHHHHHPVPKLEDFFVNNNNTQNDTQQDDSSSLTHINNYFNDHHTTTTTAFQQTNSAGSEVVDIINDELTFVAPTELGFTTCVLPPPPHSSSTLSLGSSGEYGKQRNHKAINVDCSNKKKIGATGDTFDGLGDMKLTFGITLVEEKVKLEKGVKVSTYFKEIEEMQHATKQEFIASLRRKSSGFSRGASMYRGVTRHHQQGRWQARIGRVAGNKDLYLGTFATEEEAAEAYDIAAIKFRGVNAVTNFEMNRYDVDSIMKSALPVGGAAKRLKISLESEQKSTTSSHGQQTERSNNISFLPVSMVPYGIPYDAGAAAMYHHNLYYQLPQNLNMDHTATATTSDSAGSTSSMTTAMNMLSQPTDFFPWPPQQPY